MCARVIKLVFLGVVAASFGGFACSVPDKQVVPADAGSDAPPQDGLPGAVETSIDEAPAEFASSGTAVFRFSSPIGGATFTCSVDGETPLSCTSPFSRALADGTHSFSVRAIDRSGNSDDSPAEHVWTIDTVVPNTTMIEGPPAADNSTTVRFVFDSNEDNVRFECSLDGAQFAECSSGADVGPIGDGAHTYAVRSRDRANNVDASPALHTWVVDTSTPDTQLIGGPSGATASSGASFTFVSPDAGAGATFECALDGGGFAGCVSPHAVAGLVEGAHTFAVRVRDSVGNSDPTPATRSWTVDLTPPETILESGPEGMVPVAIAAFAFSSNESDVRFECNFDSGGFVSCTSPATYTNLAQGAHSFVVRAIDMANHVDVSPVVRNWAVDTIAPDLVFTQGPGDGSTTGPRVPFAFTTTEGSPECSLDGAAFAPCTSPLVLQLRAGAHALSVRATDGAGNTTTISRSWTVACAAPDVTGAAGLLHFEDAGGQTLVNAAGGPPAIVGTTPDPEVADPSPTTGRFGTGLAFATGEGDLVTWPSAIGASNDLTISLWVRADVAAAERDLFVTGDGQLRISVIPGVGANVAFRVVAGGAALTSEPVPSAAWHRLVVSVQSTMLWMWMDDSRRSSGGVSVTMPISLDSLRLGAPAPGFSGAVDELWISLTATTTDDAALAGYCPL